MAFAAQANELLPATVTNIEALTSNDQTYAPVFNGYSEDGVQGYSVTITETEPNCSIYYRYQYLYPDGEWTEWSEYTEMLTFTDPGKYRIEAYAVAPGKSQSMTVAFEFVVVEQTDPPEIIYTEDGNRGGYIEFIEPEPDCTIYFLVQDPNGCWSDLMIYDGIPIMFTEPGYYQVEAYAVAPGKLPSVTVCETFVVRQQTYAPVFNGYSEDGVQGFSVTITETEPNCTIHYRYQYLYPDGEWTEWSEYTAMLTFTDPGKYRIEAYADAPGKSSSMTVAFEFVVVEQTDPPTIRYIDNGVYGGYIEIIEPEPDCEIYYRVQGSDGWYTDWMVYDGAPIAFPEPGYYEVEAYAVAPGKLPSVTVCETFVVRQQTYAPVFNGYSEDGVQGYSVTITETEPNCTIYYRYQYLYPDGEWTEWSEYTDMLTFTDPGKYRIEAYAVASGKSSSMTVAFEFVVVQITAQPGDVNEDGTISVADVTALIDILLDGGTPTPGCDFNGDGEVSVIDVTALIDYLLSQQ